MLLFWAGSVLLALFGGALLRRDMGEGVHPFWIFGAPVLGLALVLIAPRWLRTPIQRFAGRSPHLERRRLRRRAETLSEEERFQILEQHKQRSRERLRKSVWYRTPIFGRYDPNIRG
ncbi:MAG: hypothetical protein KDC38_06145 [Planctomycetes bacterium]|nr:hypothetical protein [Planctomycetota bacterium]